LLLDEMYPPTLADILCCHDVVARQAGHGGVLFMHGQRWPRIRNRIHHLATALDRALAEKQVPGPDDIAWLT